MFCYSFIHSKQNKTKHMIVDFVKFYESLQCQRFVKVRGKAV